MWKTRTVLLISVLALYGCGSDDAESEADLAADSTAAVGDAAGMGSMQQGTAQDADHEFLRMMSDHHEGLIAMGMDAMNRAQDDSVKSAARMLHQKQSMERDSMVAMIQRMYNEQHQPTVMPKNQAQADSLRQATGPAVDRYFQRRPCSDVAHVTQFCFVRSTNDGGQIIVQRRRSIYKLAQNMPP